MKERAPRNRTLTCSNDERASLSTQLMTLSGPVTIRDIANRVIHQEIQNAVHYLPPESVDLLILDPPYNLTKDYHGHLQSA